jgi:hypothetical protein
MVVFDGFVHEKGLFHGQTIEAWKESHGKVTLKYILIFLLF